MAKTHLEIMELKAIWDRDPCWDIETTEGFEEHAEELRAYRWQKEDEWRQKWTEVVRRKADELGTDNMKLAAYVIFLEQRIAKLEEKILS